MAHTLLAVPVPEADGLVRRLAAEWEPTYNLGTDQDIHAHITVLSPFVPLHDVDDRIHERLRGHFAKTEPFSYRLQDVRVFVGKVVYLAPEPASRFSALTEAAVAAFPGYLPYEGQYDSMIPHMTVGPIRSPEMARALVAEARRATPLGAVASEARLVFNHDSSFATVARYPFGS